jgi:hypothetical protein
MKQNIMGLFFTLTIIAALCSCKKETALPAETPVTQSVKEKLQDWYTAQTAKGQPDGDKIKFFLNAGTPDWENAKQVGTATITPVTVSGNKSGVHKFLVTNAALDGAFTSGKYVYVLKNKEAAAAAVPYSVLQEILETKKAPAGFSGSVLEYNLKHELITALTFVNGKFDEAKVEQVNSRPKLNNAAASKGQEIVSNNVDPCQGAEQYCIDWYWQTFIDGVLVYEDYLFTTCHCGQGGGGSSGSGNTSVVLCNLTEAQAQAALNAITVEITTNFYSVMGTPSAPDAKGIIRAPVTRKGGGYKLKFAPGFEPEWASTYSGIVYKDTKIPNDPWKWQSLNATGFVQIGGVVPPCISITTVPNLAPPIILADKRVAHSSGTFTGSVNWSCIASTQIRVISGTFGGVYVADDVSQ